MKNTTVKWHNEDYNLNCNIEDLEKLGFTCSSYNNDLAPSYMNKKENIQIFFFDLESDEMKAEERNFKYSLMKLDEHGEYLNDIGQTNSFDQMVKMVKSNQ